MLEFNSVENIKLTSQIFLKPEYAIHPTVSGNKIRKLKYNLDKFKIKIDQYDEDLWKTQIFKNNFNNNFKY